MSTHQWLLSVDGAVEEPYVLEWEAFTELAQTDWSGDIRCVTRWSKFGMTWRGADARVLIERAREGRGYLGQQRALQGHELASRGLSCQLSLGETATTPMRLTLATSRRSDALWQ